MRLPAFVAVFLVAVLYFTQAQAVSGEEQKAALKEENPMVLIPAGEFIRGLEDGDPTGLVWVTPKSNLYLPDYYIDKYEVTNKAYKRFVDATGHRVPFDDRYDTEYDWTGGMYTENMEDHPVALVDWHDADTYCRWAGKRLPTEAEWEKAARGIDGRYWPWGNEFDRFKANTRDFGVLMTMPVGSFPEGASPYGVMDMGGNVFEWTVDWYKAYPGTKRKHDDYGELYRVTRGGAWAARGVPYAYTIERTAQLPEHKHRSIGFRCARQIEADDN